LSLALRLPDQPEQSLPPRTSIVQAYELAQQELLILGEPGAGKSTLLVELARFLVAEAERDATQPLPILLPLASWAVNRHSLGEWLGEEIARLYHVSRRLSQQCIEAGVLPLLDGLDEMERGARTACIAAINTYHREQLRPLVVCSRATEYDAAARHERLALHTAIIVQPLESKQVDAYLVKLGKPLAGLRAAWKTDTLLQELATTPLMLQVLTLTYHDTSVRAVSQREPQLRKQIWTDYVQRMVRHKGDIKRYPLSVTTGWLRWLASEMRQRNQAIFSLETFQLDWLPQRQRNQYQWSVGLLSGLFHGLYYGLFIGLGVGLALGLLFGLLGGLNVGLRGLLIGLGVGLLNGLIIGLGSGMLSGQFPGQPNELVLRQRTGVVKLDVGLFDAAVQPYLVRFWLARSGVFPWRAVPFLEDATARILLRRVGGGYQFTHRLLLDYFADLDAQA
jgi:energy-coupling factor transporter ATP-binding protein EcfA2